MKYRIESEPEKPQLVSGLSPGDVFHDKSTRQRYKVLYTGGGVAHRDCRSVPVMLCDEDGKITTHVVTWLSGLSPAHDVQPNPDGCVQRPPKRQLRFDDLPLNALFTFYDEPDRLRLRVKSDPCSYVILETSLVCHGSDSVRERGVIRYEQIEPLRVRPADD